jgi:hypothetical protein
MQCINAAVTVGLGKHMPGLPQITQTSQINCISSAPSARSAGDSFGRGWPRPKIPCLRDLKPLPKDALLHGSNYSLKYFTMKASILVIALLAGIGKLHAQINFGIAYYQVPAGWNVVQQSPNVILEEQRKDGKTCRIIISATENVVIDNETTFLSYRQKRSTGGYSYNNPGTVVRKENTYCISFASITTEPKNNKNMKSSCFSFTNRKASFLVQLLAEDNAAEATFSNFIKTLEVEEGITNDPDPGAVKTGTKTKGKPRGRPRKNPA